MTRRLRYGPAPRAPSPAGSGSGTGGDIVLSPQGDTVYATVAPELEEGELEKNVQPMVLEYFEHGDTREVMVRGGCAGALGAVGSLRDGVGWMGEGVPWGQASR